MVLPELVTGLVPTVIVVIITLPGEIAATDVILPDLRVLVMTETEVAEDVEDLVVDVAEGVVVVEEGLETEVVEEVDLVVDEEDMVEIEVDVVVVEEVVDLEDEMVEAEEGQKDLVVWTEEIEDLSHIKLAAAVYTDVIIDLHMTNSCKVLFVLYVLT